jgi:phosphatidate cytidylyltransferase
MSGLKVRVASALVALALFILCFVFWGVNATYILLYFAISLAQWEYINLALDKARKTLRVGFLVLSQYYLLHCLPLDFLPSLSPIKLATQFFVFMCFFGLFTETEKLEEIRNDIFATCFGFIYLSVIPGLLAVTLVKNANLLAEHFGFLLLTVFAGDVFAYFAGLLFGKKKMLPTVSPKKTIVGCVGGLLGSVLIGSSFYYFLIPGFSIKVLGICLLMGLYAQTGDFLESLIKRIAGKKDSGKIMPGHGGILDRIDGVLFAIPAFYFFFF